MISFAQLHDNWQLACAVTFLYQHIAQPGLVFIDLVPIFFQTPNLEYVITCTYIFQECKIRDCRVSCLLAVKLLGDYIIQSAPSQIACITHDLKILTCIFL